MTTIPNNNNNLPEKFDKGDTLGFVRAFVTDDGDKLDRTELGKMSFDLLLVVFGRSLDIQTDQLVVSDFFFVAANLSRHHDL